MQDPIFIHALWRTGSTYLWGKFRTRDELCCFFEPFHESLIAKSKDALLSDFTRAAKKFSHDTIKHNYYDEFEVDEQGGARHFRSRFVVDKYAMGLSEKDDELTTYLQSLIDIAKGKGHRPVLQFNRSILRAEWMKQRFGGAHLYLNRNLADVHQSYTEKGYYIPSYITIIRQNAAHPLFKEIAEHLDQAPYEYEGRFNEATSDHDAKRFKARLTSSTRKTRSLSEQDKKDVVTFFWTLGLASASRYSDMIIDSDRIIQGSGRTMPQMFSDVSGLDVDFSDLRIKTQLLDPLNVSPRVREIIRNAVDKIGPDWDVLSSTEMSQQTRVQVALAMQ